MIYIFQELGMEQVQGIFSLRDKEQVQGIFYQDIFQEEGRMVREGIHDINQHLLWLLEQCKEHTFH